MIKIGFLSANSTDIVTNYPIKIDIANESFMESGRSGMGDLQSITGGEKATVRLEYDFLSQSDLGALRRVLQNRKEPHKLFLDFPAADSQLMEIAGTTHKAYTAQDDAGTFTNYSGAGTEFTPTEYTYIKTFDANYVEKASTASVSDYYKYVYFFIVVDLSSFISAYGVDYIKRITLAFRDLYLSDSYGGLGFKIDYLDNSYSGGQYVEIRRQGFTVDDSNTQFASIRPVNLFSDFSTSGALDGSNKAVFRIRNLYANRDLSGAVSMKCKFIKGFVNGFGCVFNNNDSFTYNNSYTGSGQVGIVTLMEL